MAMQPLPHDFKEFLKLLNSKGVEYLVIGGYAVGYHGYPRPTGDIDIWIVPDPRNAEKVRAAVAEFGFDLPELTTSLFREEHRVVRMGVQPVRIELLSTISGVTFDQCYASRVVVTIDDLSVNFIGLEHLKLNKKASGRHKDLNDLENLP